MPTQTFFHLPKSKQDKLIQAAKKEFSRVPLHEASIANIVKEAEIPRGSFYQYFEGKEDLYYYLLNEISEENNAQFHLSLQENDGDIFEAFIDSFQFVVQGQKKQEHKKIFKNAFLNMNYKIENILANNLYEENRKNNYLSIINLINKKKLNIQNEEELHQLMKIVLSVTFHNFVQIFVKELTEQEALKNYVKQIELLKRGLSNEYSNTSS